MTPPRPAAAKSTVVNLGKAAAHPLRARIMQAVQDGLASSPNQLAIVLNEPLGNVSYHVGALVEFGCLRLWKTEPRRGAVEHFYKSTGAWSPGREVTLTEAQRRLAAKAIAAAGEGFEDPDLEALYDFLMDGLLEEVPA